MNLFDGTAIAPENDPVTQIWPETHHELRRRGLLYDRCLSASKAGDGATALVLKAREEASGRVVAVKVYKDPDQRVQGRDGRVIPMSNYFENERRMLAGLESCPVVPRYHYSVDSRSALTGKLIQPFHVMQFVPGKRVTEYSRESLGGDSRHRVDRIIDLFQQVVRTVGQIHHQGYLHRDISDGNVLVDDQGRIHLVDLAEASPEAEKNTRLMTTVGKGTDGYASPALRKHRATTAEDVHAVCTIGYALFTNRWKHEGETVQDWRANLLAHGAPAAIADLLARGMTERDVNREADPSVWHSSGQVDEAIETYRRRRRTRKRLVRWSLWGLAAAAVLLVVATIGWWQWQSQAFFWNLNQLEKHRTTLAEQPYRTDSRVQRHVQAADALEADARRSHTSGDTAGAAVMLDQALAELQQANVLAAELRQISPLREPLQQMLDNTRWNRDCDAVRRILAELQEQYLAACRQLDEGEEPRTAGDKLSELYRRLVHLLQDNQRSLDLADQFRQFESVTAAMDPRLAAMSELQHLASQKEKTHAALYQAGKWPEAATAIGSLQQNLNKFLERHETADQRAARMASNTELLNDQLARNRTLQAEIESLNGQLSDLRDQLKQLDKKNSDILIAAAQDRTAREQAAKQLEATRQQLAQANESLQDQQSRLRALEAEHKELTQQAMSDQEKLAEYQRRLASGSRAYREQTAELAEIQARLQQAEHLVERLQKSVGGDSERAQREVRLVAAEEAIRQFEPENWDQANERLIAEVVKYEDLLTQRRKELGLGKTDKHRDIQALDARLASQFRVVVEALGVRNEADRQAWQALESQVHAQQVLREVRLEEGWAKDSGEVRKIDGQIAALRKRQQPYVEGKTRRDQDSYEFTSWEKLSDLPDVKYAQTIAAFGDLKVGTTYTNSLGQRFVWLPPGTFQMGSPPDEEGRDDDERLHTVELTRGLFLQTHEVTQGQYQRRTGQAPWKGQIFEWEGADVAASYISWDDAVAFIKQLNTDERSAGKLPPGWEYRLPTEAEWEYAARAGTTSRFSFGDNESQLGDYAWCGGNAGHAHPVGQKKPNAWGLYDMMGNVWEWTGDWYGDYPSGKATDPQGPDGGSSRVYRGGGWYYEPALCRLANRSRLSPGSEYFYLGFRLALVQSLQE